MNDRARREFLGIAGLVVGGTVAGCRSPDRATTPNEPDTVGDVAAVRGLEIRFVDYVLTDDLTFVPRGEDEVTVAGDAPDRDPKTVDARDGAQFLLLVVEVENLDDEPKGVPLPGDPRIADGDLYLELDRSRQDPLPHDPTEDRSFGGAYRYDGEWIDRYTLALGVHQAELPAETAERGWIPYEVPADFDPESATLYALANPEGAERQYTWSFTRA